MEIVTNSLKPTQGQLRDFWERFGCKHIPKKEDARFGGPPQNYWDVRPYWVYPDGSNHRELPPTSLGSLFGYAIPKIIENMDSEALEEFELFTVKSWVDTWLYQKKDPSVSLFWILNRL